MESQRIKMALISLDMAKTNINGAIAALNQNKTFSADVSYSSEAVEGAVKFLLTALEDLRDFSEGAKNTEQLLQPDSDQ